MAAASANGSPANAKQDVKQESLLPEYRSACDTFQVSFDDVLKTPAFRDALARFCAKSGHVKYLQFLRAVEELSASVAKAQEQQLDLSATATPAVTALHENYLHGNNKLILPEHSAADVAFVAEQVTAGTVTADGVKHVENLAKHVRGVLETMSFPRFIQSDEYIDMMSQRLETANNAAEKLSAMDAIMGAALGPDQGWVNEEGYQSIRVDVLAARGLRTGLMGAGPHAYVVVSVDTTSYRGKPRSGRNGDIEFIVDDATHFEFPLLSTTQFIELNVWDRNKMVADKHLGTCYIDVAEVVHEQRSRRRGVTDFKRSPAPKARVRQVTASASLNSATAQSSSSISVPSATTANAPAAAAAASSAAPVPPASPTAGPAAASKPPPPAMPFPGPRSVSPAPSADELADESEGVWLPIRKPKDDDTADSAKERGEVKVRVVLSPEVAKDTGHKALASHETFRFADAIRQTVSKKKRRFRKDGFDLDLTYITDRIIAMGFPSVLLEGVYRNNIDVVKKFLDKRHPQSYRVYNLCSERSYDPAKFDGCVRVYGFEDHNPCPFGMIDKFCADVHGFLSEHPQHIAAIHCKAGKGRTGLLISCYMLYVQLFPNATSALKYYAHRRTQNKKGVTIPSQIRYVYYYDRYLKFQRMVSRAKSRVAAVLGPTAADSKEDADALSFQLMSDNDSTMSTADREAFTKQQRAASVLGFKQRQMSVTERADLLDYLHTCNTRWRYVDSPSAPSSPNSGAPASSSADQKIADVEVVEDVFRGAFFLPDAEKHRAVLKSVVLHTLPAAANKTGDNIYFTMRNDDLKFSFSSKKIKPVWDEQNFTLTFNFPEQVELFGDVCIVFFAGSTFGKTKLLQFWFNTRFVLADGGMLRLTKLEMDKANKDKKHKAFTPMFSIDVNLKPVHTKDEMFATLNEIRKSVPEFSAILEQEMSRDLSRRVSVNASALAAYAAAGTAQPSLAAAALAATAAAAASGASPGPAAPLSQDDQDVTHDDSSDNDDTVTSMAD